MKKINWDIVISGVSWVIVALLVYAAIHLILTPISGFGPVSQILGKTFAKIFWCALYSAEALALMIAKLYKTKKFRKWVLLAVYLTGIFTSVLAFAIHGGFTVGMIANIAFTIAAALCWLHWKNKTEYICPKYFYDKVAPLRDDLPPS